jgi:hypothetical protein
VTARRAGGARENGTDSRGERERQGMGRRENRESDGEKGNETDVWGTTDIE